MPSIISFEKQDAFIASETEKQNNKEKKKKKKDTGKGMNRRASKVSENLQHC